MKHNRCILYSRPQYPLSSHASSPKSADDSPPSVVKIHWVPIPNYISKHYWPFIHAPVTDSHFSPTQRPAAPNFTHAKRPWSISPRLIHLVIYAAVCPNYHANIIKIPAIYPCTTHGLPFLAHALYNCAKFNPRRTVVARLTMSNPHNHLRGHMPQFPREVTSFPVISANPTAHLSMHLSRTTISRPRNV